MKKEFSEKYKIATPLYLTAHIALVNLIQLEKKENPLLNHLETIARGYHPFKVDLKDYGSLPTHSIFINVVSKLQVQNLVKELKSIQHFMTLDKDNKPHFMADPNITIAGKLLPWQYEKGWAEYSHYCFTGSFIAEEIALLKRPLEFNTDDSIRSGKYKIISRFTFRNLPVNSKQGELFI